MDRTGVDALDFAQQIRPGAGRNQQSASLAIRLEQPRRKQIHPAMAAFHAHKLLDVGNVGLDITPKARGRQIFKSRARKYSQAQS